ncbi:unnamed protein product [Protopolystoma xenopodis]|uniref:Uncharacterized protein n=1 Tax=Protopolystoma xenopodis TaxID=117903 RepID=A0A448X675_9PLAT|nr:unnamed protein product [Protopolystoma xenopodis]
MSFLNLSQPPRRLFVGTGADPRPMLSLPLNPKPDYTSTPAPVFLEDQTSNLVWLIHIGFNWFCIEVEVDLKGYQGPGSSGPPSWSPRVLRLLPIGPQKCVFL